MCIIKLQVGTRAIPLTDLHQWIPMKIAKHNVSSPSKLQLCKLYLGLVYDNQRYMIANAYWVRCSNFFLIWFIFTVGLVLNLFCVLIWFIVYSLLNWCWDDLVFKSDFKTSIWLEISVVSYYNDLISWYVVSTLYLPCNILVYADMKFW